ncbi:alginate export family protein [Pontiella sulfatireligans]|uniref:Alginate export domain-containing protein n=1 Tax=Pontiella sulfatireligans TaxID=2750658 RepID=A0A6C2UFZ7_9BACT|nr:hypothetical protein [Pontiella sulfatireligans]VGO18447.1 hypothetical protein SCARR_00500 [Pontiella sulfatireligans]
MENKRIIMLLAAASAASVAFAAETEIPATNAAPEIAEVEAGEAMAMSELAPKEEDLFKMGGDVRLREVYFNNIPYNIGAQARGGENEFQRYRLRLWGELHPAEDLYFRTRAVYEFRTGSKGTARQGWESEDEIVFDNLFVDWKLDDIAFRIGRQDLIYGTGKVILDGTPKDGSRTIYFNAAKASYTGIEDTTVDFLAMYMPSEDELAIHGQDRDLIGKTGGYYHGDEVGGGVYAKNQSCEALPFEAYYLIKTQEGEWTSPATGISHDDEVRHTFGTRLMPKFSETLSGNLELAYQTGDDISAYMIDSLVTLKLTALDDLKASVGLGWYHLSGDDPSSSTDEGWNPLWARWPQYSELYVYSYDTEGAGRWSNVSMPHIDFSISPFERLKMDFLLGYMFAPEDDGVGGGHNRGLLFTLWNKFTIGEGMFSEKDKLTGHLLIELMQPDDYYSSNQENETAAFIRAELSYAF